MVLIAAFNSGRSIGHMWTIFGQIELVVLRIIFGVYREDADFPDTHPPTTSLGVLSDQNCRPWLTQ